MVGIIISFKIPYFNIGTVTVFMGGLGLNMIDAELTDLAYIVEAKAEAGGRVTQYWRCYA